MADSFIDRIIEAFADIHSDDMVEREAAVERTRLLFQNATDIELLDLAEEDRKASGDRIGDIMVNLREKRELAKNRDLWHDQMGDPPYWPLWEKPPEGLEDLFEEE